MTTFGVTPANENAFEEYFSSSTSYVGSRRLLADMATVKNDYENVWSELGPVERDQVLDENVIRPEAVLK